MTPWQLLSTEHRLVVRNGYKQKETDTRHEKNLSCILMNKVTVVEKYVKQKQDIEVRFPNFYCVYKRQIAKNTSVKEEGRNQPSKGQIDNIFSWEKMIKEGHSITKLSV